VLLALVLNNNDEFSSHVLGEENIREEQGSPTENDYFGTCIKKKEDVLRVDFQNVGGLPLHKKKLKDDAIRCGISCFEFDIFGLAETNTDWRLQTEDLKLHERTSGWWEALNISYSYNTTAKPIALHQWGGTSLFSLNKVAHRAMSKGRDPTSLGRWSWTRFQGRNNRFIRIFAGYCPNPPTAPMSVYSQHRAFFQLIKDNRCPRTAFAQDITEDIAEAIKEGDAVIIILDGNMDMRNSILSQYFSTLNLQEAIISKYGQNGPSTFKRNTSKTHMRAYGYHRTSKSCKEDICHLIN
jgi:hypothetical protein